MNEDYVRELVRKLAIEILGDGVSEIHRIVRWEIQREYGFEVDNTDWDAYVNRQLGAPDVGRDEASQAAELRRRMDEKAK